MKRYLKCSSFKKKLFSALFLFYLVPLLFTTFSAYTIMEKMIYQRELTAYQAILENTISEFNKEIYSIMSHATQIQQSKYIKQLTFLEKVTPTYPDVFEVEEFGKSFLTFCATKPILDEMFIYFHNNGCVLSTLSAKLESFEWFNEEVFHTTVLNELIKSKKINQLEHPMYVSNVIANNYGKQKEGILYIIPAYTLKTDKPNTTLFYFLDREAIVTLFKSRLPKGCSTYIIDQSTNAIIGEAHNSEEKITMVSDELISLEVNEAIRVGDINYHVIKSKIGEIGLEYITLINIDNIKQTQNLLKMIFLLLITMFSVLGFVLASYIATKNYRPIKKILDLIEQYKMEKIDGEYANEISLLEHQIQSIVTKMEVMNIQLEEYKPILGDAYLLWLLTARGMRENMDVNKNLEYLDIKFKYKYYSCVIMSKTLEKILEDKLSELNNKEEVLIKKLTIEHERIIILNYNEIRSINKFINQLFNHNTIKEGGYYIGISKSYNQLSEFCVMYRQARELKCFVSIEVETEVGYEQIITEKSITYIGYYESYQETAIKNYLKIGEVESIKIIIREIITQNYKEGIIFYTSVMNIYQKLKVIAISTLEEVEINLHISKEKNICDEKFERLDEIIESLYRIYEKCSEIVQKAYKPMNDNLKEQVNEYISTHLTNCDLSLKSLGEYLNMSESYISRLFKELIGENYLDYINKRRIEESKELLKEGLEVNKVCKLVGYDNDTTYRRLFKKYEGITPSQYKKLNNE